jgi:hypothetical protein
LKSSIRNQRFSWKVVTAQHWALNQPSNSLLAQNLTSSECQHWKSSETAVMIYPGILSRVQSQPCIYLFIARKHRNHFQPLLLMRRTRIAKVGQLLAAWRKDTACISPKIAKTKRVVSLVERKQWICFWKVPSEVQLAVQDTTAY